jgi:outer membrane protein assembly factor BamE (lipoprotein component of BamABCDE complex)
MNRIRGIVLAVLLVGSAIACSPTIRNHGHAPDDALLAEISVGHDTRDSVAEKIGRPVVHSEFDKNSWYYIASTMESYTYHAPKVVKRRIVAVRFDDNGVVKAVNKYGLKDGRIIDLATQTTPTHGRQLSILQQLLGNFGHITAQDLQTQQ